MLNLNANFATLVNQNRDLSNKICQNEKINSAQDDLLEKLTEMGLNLETKESFKESMQ